MHIQNHRSMSKSHAQKITVFSLLNKLEQYLCNIYIKLKKIRAKMLSVIILYRFVYSTFGFLHVFWWQINYA